MLSLNNWRGHRQIPALQFKLFQAALGLWMIYQFASIGFVETDSTSRYWQEHPFLTIGGLLSSAFFSFGIGRHVFAVVTWLFLSSCIFLEPKILDFDLEYLGWLFLFSAFFVKEKREPLLENNYYSCISLLYFGAWLVLGVGYSLSGLSKTFSTEWQSGMVVKLILQSGISRFPNLIIWNAIPDILYQFTNWLILISELLFLPFILFTKLRPWAFVVMTFIHLGIGSLTYLSELSISALIFHLILFEFEWLPSSLLRKLPSEQNIVS